MATELRIEGADGKLCPQDHCSKRLGISTSSSAEYRGTEGKLASQFDGRQNDEQERPLDSTAAC